MVFAALVLAAISAAAADDVIGQASIIDGDTLEIHGNRIRLLGHPCAGSGPQVKSSFSNSSLPHG
jgi:hypothetical protein